MGSKIETDDRFKKFGTVSFTAITKVNDFIGHLEQGRVAGTRCKDCGKAFFPPRADCCRCLTSNMEWFPVTGSGKLVTFSGLQFAPAGFQEDVPYRIALLDYGTYRVFGRIHPEVPEEKLKIGMEMATEVERLSDGRLTYVFRKV